MDITAILRRVHDGDRASLDQAVALLYRELKRIASNHVRREGSGTPMEATTLVHEAYLRLVHSKHPEYQNRAHFYAISSRVMRRILVDAARARLATRRGSGQPAAGVRDAEEIPAPGAAPSDRKVLEVDAALERLAAMSALKAELIEMRYFGGMTAEECAEVKAMSVHMVRKEIRLAQAWLRSEMAAAGEGPVS